MTKQDFRVNHILPAEMTNKDFIISDFFDSALEQIEWFRQNENSKNPPNPFKEAYLNAIAFSENEIQYAKDNATVEQVDNGINFSFPVRFLNNSFDEKNEEGRRMWLRQHISDHFYHYSMTAMMKKGFNIHKKLSDEEAKRFENHFEALELVLNTSYELRTEHFWISGE